MLCPKCRADFKYIRTYNTTHEDENETTIRKKLCEKCGHTWQTTEYFLTKEVLKKNERQ